MFRWVMNWWQTWRAGKSIGRPDWWPDDPASKGAWGHLASMLLGEGCERKACVLLRNLPWQVSLKPLDDDLGQMGQLTDGVITMRHDHEDLARTFATGDRLCTWGNVTLNWRQRRGVSDTKTEVTLQGEAQPWSSRPAGAPTVERGRLVLVGTTGA